MSTPPDPASAPAESELQLPELPDAGEIERAERAIREATFTGRDPQHLVTVVVDGDGQVARVSFGRTVGSQSAEAVEQAVLAAIGSAQHKMNDAWQKLAARMEAGGSVLGDEPAAFGGAEPYVEETPDERG